MRYAQWLRRAGKDGNAVERPVVCVQGLGMAGLGMAIAVADARDDNGRPRFNVIGVELPTQAGRAKVEAINRGVLPFACNDASLAAAFSRACACGNLVATDDDDAFNFADVVLMDINVDLAMTDGRPFVDFTGIRTAARTLGDRMPTGSLLIVESTVPPGTCRLVVAPVLVESLRRRGLPESAVQLAHSYERVMPGKDYLDSIVRFWRVYAGTTTEAAAACERFLSQVIDVTHFPLRRLSSTTASELAKVLENAYRATNIAFIEEWSRLAEATGVDMFEVVEAIRVRPTHNNIRQPGFGVGGGCLTKDPLFGAVSAEQLFRLEGFGFPFSTLAVATNERMPLVTVDKMQTALGGGIAGRRILLLGVSYRQDVDDTRRSPSQSFVEACEGAGARVQCHDPLVRRWEELGRDLPDDIPPANGYDAVVFAVPHACYRQLDLAEWLNGATPLIVDANNVLTANQGAAARRLGARCICIGRGDDA